jgi:PAS domain S-box-containing protein
MPEATADMNNQTVTLSQSAVSLALRVSKVGTWEWNVKTGSLVWSDELKKLYNIQSESELTYEKYFGLLHPDDRMKMKNIIQKALQDGKEYRTEHRIIWPDGSVHWLDAHGIAVIENGKAVRMVGTAVNIDEHKNSEHKLRNYRDSLENKVRQQILVSELGLKALGGGSIKSIMNKAVRILKDSLNVEYTKVLELLPDGKNMVLRAGLGWHQNIVVDKSTVDTGSDSQAGYTLASKHPVIVNDLRAETRFNGQLLLQEHNVVSGMSCIIYGSTGPYGVLGIHTTSYREFNDDDIQFLQSVANILAMTIQRHQAEFELKESEQRFRHVADSAPVLIWMSGVDKLCHYFNQTWLDFTGRTIEQERGNGWTEGVHPEDFDRCVDVYAKSFDARKPFTMEYRLRRHDGKYRWLLDNGRPRYSIEGKFLGYVGSCIDIEELKSAKKRKKDLEVINKKLKEHKKKLEALNNTKDEFISIASHQLRTPATGVKQYVGMLLEGFAGEFSSDQLSLLQIAYESNERQLNIINDLLRVAQLDGGKIVLQTARTELISLLMGVIEEQSTKAKSKLQNVTVECSKKSAYARTDSARIRMVFENLIDNAIKYSPESTQITVRVEDEGSIVRIQVVDQGVGIAKKELTSLFQKFKRIDNHTTAHVDGTGLGLYWAEKIITLHNGSLTVVSKPKKGSTFTVTLPK